MNIKIDQLDAEIKEIKNGVGLYGKLTEEKRGEAIAACRAEILALRQKEGKPTSQ